MITPSVGRIVWFFPELEQRDPNGQPLAALVAKVIDDRTVNLMVSAADGSTFGRQHVALLQPDDQRPYDPVERPDQAHATWMPYQLGQAAKTEAAIAASPALEPLQRQLAELAAAVDIKIERFGDSLDPVLSEIGSRLASLEAPPPVPPAPPAPPVGAGGEAAQPSSP